MNINEIVGRLKAGGLDASSTNRSAAVYVTEARSGRAVPGWFGFRIVCDSEATERRVRSILSRWYDIEANGNVWRLRAKNRVPLMAIKRGGVPPTPPTPTDGPMYFEAVQSNSTVSMMSTLATAPDLEYSTDGETWQEWQYTTTTEDEMTVHTFDTLTLTAVGDRVYLRGDNPDGLAIGGLSDAPEQVTVFSLSGTFNSGGRIISLIDKTLEATELPDYAFPMMLANTGGSATLLSPPSFEGVTSCGKLACAYMLMGQTLLGTAIDFPDLISMGKNAFMVMYMNCNFDMSDDGSTLNFDFPSPPVTAGETTYATAYDVAEWMGNTNGFTEP